MRSALTIIIITAFLAFAPQALAQQTESNPVGDAIKQPFADLNLIRDEISEALVRAAEAPYSLDGLGGCPALVSEIGELDAVLGADVDAEGAGGGGSHLVGDLLKGAFALPFRGVVRRLTGAHRRDQAKARAVVAGVARRGFLKGVATSKGCALPRVEAASDSSEPDGG